MRKMFIVLVTVLAISNAMFQASTCLAVLCFAYGLQAKHTPFVSPKTQEAAVLATSGWLKALPGAGGAGAVRASRVGRGSVRHASLHQSMDSAGSLTQRVMDYNVLETVLISSCVVIILGGMVFQSAALTPGTAGYVVLTILVEAAIFGSLVTFIVVLVTETRNSCQKKKPAADAAPGAKSSEGQFSVGNPMRAAQAAAAAAAATSCSDDVRPARVRRTADPTPAGGTAGTELGANGQMVTPPLIAGSNDISAGLQATGYRAAPAAATRVHGSVASGDERAAARRPDFQPVLGTLPAVAADTAASATDASVKVCAVAAAATPGERSAAAITAAAARIQAARRASMARRRVRVLHRERVAGSRALLAPARGGGDGFAQRAHASTTSLHAGQTVDARLAAAAAARIQAARRGSVVRRQFLVIRGRAAATGGIGGAAGPGHGAAIGLAVTGGAGPGVAGAHSGSALTASHLSRLSYVSPSGWQLYVDEDDGDEFYYNTRTLASQRSVPDDYKYVSPSGWTDRVDEEGARFFYNVRTEEVTWERPRDHA